MSVEVCNNPIVDRIDLDFRPEFLKSHFESLVNKGYSQREAENITLGITQTELTYTFLERFTREKVVHYSYYFVGDKLVSPRYEVFGDIADRYRKTIDNRTKEGKPVKREEAEFAGFLTVKSELSASSAPKTFVIFSPPPTDNLWAYPGYADYNFYYFGRWDPETRTIDMFAWRNIKSLEEQRREANRLLKGEYINSGEAHPNDFLRRPIFIDGSSFESFREVIFDMPSGEEFEKAKLEKYAGYRAGIANLARMLVGFIANGATLEVLDKAHLQIEMDFTKWVTDGVVKQIKMNPLYLEQGYHSKFAASVMENWRFFMPKYREKATQFACGSCGGSVMSVYQPESLLFDPVISQFSGDFVSQPKSCPNCGEKISFDAVKCGSCQMTKAEYDAKMASRN